VATTENRGVLRTLNPVHAVLLASALPLFLGALLSDWAYSSTYHVQWINFASWLVAGALLFAGMALVWSLIDALRADERGTHRWLSVGLLAATFLLGFINALVHSKDGWASMPMGLILSIIVLLLAIASVWAAFSSRKIGETR